MKTAWIRLRCTAFIYFPVYGSRIESSCYEFFIAISAFGIGEKKTKNKRVNDDSSAVKFFAKDFKLHKEVMWISHENIRRASDMLMPYQLKHERGWESDENSLWRCTKRNLVCALGRPRKLRRFIKFPIARVSIYFISTSSENKNAPAAGRQKIVNLYKLMDRLGRERRGKTTQS